MSELYAETINRTDCLEYLDEYVRNLEQNPDDYDMLKAAKTLHLYVRVHVGELDRQAHAIGWLPLEVIEPETIDGILESCKWQDASGVGKLGDEWMGEARCFVASWHEADDFFQPIGGDFSEDEFSPDMGLMIVEGWGCIPDPFWQAWWKSHPYETVMIDGEYWPISVAMYELYLNGVFDADDDEAMARRVACFIECMENAWLKHSVPPNEYAYKALNDTGLPMAYWTTGTKED